jgi:hypothetical protein
MVLRPGTVIRDTALHTTIVDDVGTSSRSG